MIIVFFCSTLEPGSCKEAESGLAPIPEDVSLAPAPVTVVEPPAQDSEGLTREIKRYCVMLHFIQLEHETSVSGSTLALEYIITINMLTYK